MILFIVSSTVFSQIGIGDAVIQGTGAGKVFQSPVFQDQALNPASFYNGIYTEFTPVFLISVRGQNDAFLSSFGISIPILKVFNIGLRSDAVYNQNFYYTFPPDSNEWDKFTEHVHRIGGITKLSGLLSGKFGDFQIGLRYGYLLGNSEYRWNIDFDNYRDIYDTTQCLYSGIAYSGGILWKWNTFKAGLFAEKLYITGDTAFTKVDIHGGLSIAIKSAKVFLSFTNQWPSLGFMLKNFSLGLGYGINPEINQVEKRMGLAWTFHLKKNRITLFTCVRDISSSGNTGLALWDTEYSAGISMEFIE